MKLRLILVISLVMGLIMLLGQVKQDTKLIFCDVGQGDGVLITNSKTQLLIDTGPDNKKIMSCLERYLSPFDKTIDALIVSHADSDHSGGLSDVLKSYKIRKIFTNQELKPLIEHNYYPINLIANDIVKMGLISFEVVNPEKIQNLNDDSNDGSISGILSYKDKRIFMSGDISNEIEKKIVWQKTLNQKVDILKISHHGSSEASSLEILDVLKPSEAVISVGKKNRFGHPKKEVLDKLKKRGIKIRRTDLEGDIIFDLD